MKKLLKDKIKLRAAISDFLTQLTAHINLLPIPESKKGMGEFIDRLFKAFQTWVITNPADAFLAQTMIEAYQGFLPKTFLVSADKKICSAVASKGYKVFNPDEQRFRIFLCTNYYNISEEKEVKRLRD